MSGFVDRTERVNRAAISGRSDASVGALRAGPEPSELQIHRAIIELLDTASHAGLFAFHVPNGEKRPDGVGGKLKRMGTRRGMPDVCILFRGRLFCLEIKKRGGRVSPDQRIAHAQIIACGAEVRTVYSLDDAITVLRDDWGMLR